MAGMQIRSQDEGFGVKGPISFEVFLKNRVPFEINEENRGNASIAVLGLTIAAHQRK